MKQILYNAIQHMPAPLPAMLQDSFRYVRYEQVRRKYRSHRQILSHLESPGEIGQGPFQGMRYVSSATHFASLTKLVGTYEIEVYPAIEEICAAGCDRIIDIGTAEGYYAIGLAIRNPGVPIIGFEMDPSVRYYLRRNARLNGVSDRIKLRGRCDLDSLSQVLDGSRLPAVICDCEGAEDSLLRPDKIETLRRAFVLVETHDGLTTDAGVLEGIVDRLKERFSPTHQVEIIKYRDRKSDDLPAGNRLSPEEATEAMDEGRPWAEWIFMSPRFKPDVD